MSQNRAAVHWARLMALLPEEFHGATAETNFRHYEPRCAHGSSLSAGMHALVAASYGYGYPAYAYGYGYPAYSYGYAYPAYSYGYGGYYGGYRPYYRSALYGGYRVARRVAIYRARWH